MVVQDVEAKLATHSGSVVKVTELEQELEEMRNAYSSTQEWVSKGLSNIVTSCLSK